MVLLLPADRAAVHAAGDGRVVPGPEAVPWSPTSVMELRLVKAVGADRPESIVNDKCTDI